VWEKLIRPKFLKRHFLQEAEKNEARDLYEEVVKFIRFDRSEFACKCGCGQSGVDYELLFMVEILRVELEHILNAKIVVEVTSGNRCLKHNSLTPGAFVNSYHTKSMAGDFKFRYKNTDKYVDSGLLYNLACRLFPGRYGIGQYSNRIHLDCRKGKARWKK
jgi:uncharacterized protein YcbK (DUF882 family)